MFCQHCGAEINENAPICLKCGCLNSNDTTVTKTEKQSNNTGLITLILLLLLGIVGAHRFYLKKYASAMGMLLLFIGGYLGIILTAAALEIQQENGFTYYDTIYMITLGISITSIISWQIWWIIDVIKLSTGRLKDSQGNAIIL